MVYSWPAPLAVLSLQYIRTAGAAAAKVVTTWVRQVPVRSHPLGRWGADVTVRVNMCHPPTASVEHASKLVLRDVV